MRTSETREPAPHLVLLDQEVTGHAIRSPNAVAVRHGQLKLSYRELDEAANYVAAELAAQGVGPGDIVLVTTGRCLELPIGILGVLKTGAMYVAVDEFWPSGRLQHALGASVVAGVVRSARASGTLPAQAVHAAAVFIDTASRRRSFQGPGTRGSEDAACVFFTSGSTGRARGIISTHRAIARVLVGSQPYPLDAQTVFFQSAPLPWDGLALELWAPLLNGGVCVLSEAARFDLTSLEQARQLGVNSLWLTSSLLNVVVEERPDLLRGLRLIMTGGERVSRRHVATLLKTAPGANIHLGYGPAESAIFALTHGVRADDVSDNALDLPLGRAVPGTQVWILDDNLRPVQPGTPGEIVLAGDGLAISYLGDPKETSERFRRIIVEGNNVRVYLTGDYAVLDDSNKLRFRGRRDRQVKVHGVRCELDEIEVAVTLHPSIKACAVVTTAVDGSTPDDFDLAMMVVFETATKVTDASQSLAALRRHVQSILPATLVPRYTFPTAVIPTSANGKTDYTAVKSQAIKAVASLQHGRTGTATEDRHAAVAELARVLLRDDTLGLNTDLLGRAYSSLALVRLSARLSAHLGKPVAARDIYAGRTLAGICRIVEQVAPGAPEARPASWTSGALSSAETRLWLTEQLFGPIPENYISLAYAVDGRLEIPVLRRALIRLASKHEVLRTCYPSVSGTPVRRVLSDASEVSVLVLDLRAEAVGASASLRLLQPARFDVERGPLWRVAVLHLDEGHDVLAVAVHHLIFDGWSEHVLVRDLGKFYEGGGADWQAAPYTAYVRQERRPPQEKVAALADQLREADGVVRRSSPSLIASAATFQIRVAGLRPRLRARASDDGVSELAMLCGAFARCLLRATSSPRICFGTVLTGRQDAAFDNTIGFFVNTVPLVVSRSEPAKERVLHAQLLEASEDPVPFEALVAQAAVPRTHRHPLFQSWFILHDLPAVPTVLGELPIARIADWARESSDDLVAEASFAGDDLILDITVRTDLDSDTPVRLTLEHFASELNARVNESGQASSATCAI